MRTVMETKNNSQGAVGVSRPAIGSSAITPSNSKERVADAITVLSFFNDVSDDVFAIIDIVQSNQKFFGGLGGESCLRLAARKLRALIEGDAQRKNGPCSACGDGDTALQYHTHQDASN